ncbi:hypothetical protein MVEG_01464 [Podila verticillata NRRL 6337]|nr:hypothetical protein MVEG_01464 [Podila verticillata NRRL 6337]
MIAQFLSHDLKTQHRLLAVNRLFLYTVVPLMLHNPILNWQILHDQTRFKTSLEKLLLSQPLLFQLLKGCFEDPRKKTTVDYSKYFKRMEPSERKYADLHTFVQLIEPLPEAIGENVDDFGLDAVNEAEVEGMEEDLESGEDEDEDEEEKEWEEGEEMYVDSEEEIESESNGDWGERDDENVNAEFVPLPAQV